MKVSLGSSVIPRKVGCGSKRNKLVFETKIETIGSVVVGPESCRTEYGV